MKMFRRILMACVCIVFAQAKVNAQEVKDTTTLFAELRNMQTVYKASNISFNIHYTYASELRPAEVLDSLDGLIEMAGSNVHYILNNTETYANGRYNIILFKDDKLIYLAKPSAVNSVDPVEQIRTMINNGGIRKCIVSQEGKTKSIQISFGENSPCKEMNLQIEKATGYLTTMTYMVKTELMMDPGTAGANVTEQYGDYAVVKCFYDNFKPFAPDAKYFDEGQFFYKEEKEFKPTAAYSDFKVFVGSPDL